MKASSAPSKTPTYNPLELSVPADYTPEALRAAIRTIEPLADAAAPDVWAQELRALKQRYRWKDPRVLLAYTKAGDYKDLFVYFDNADKSSPINEPATKAFKCYGLDGNQTSMNWTAVRGTCVVGRAEPPAISSFTSPLSSQQTSFPYEPLLPEELADWPKHKLTCSARKQPQGTASSSTSTTAKAAAK
ncbi:hypothetical protein QOT17_012662 [Balamuthia mandrillaris]